ncbi:insecticidal delta-endotoxin Cry8Ea1 family protein, partial [Bacillus cereus]|uniref:insecticidal delta-endotoxin Cry8Ea1 family protein n=1 Tax=Bacillus cereus TaxID=1396 RepID=UPI003A8CF206
MEHTDKTINKEQQVTPNSQAASGNNKVIEVLADGSVKFLNDKVFKSRIKKAIVSLAGDTLKQIYKDAYSGDFTGTARTIVLGALALSPYGGASISPMLGLLWPSKEDNQFKELQDQIKQLDNKVNALNNANLEATYNALMKELKKFENGMSDNPDKSVFYDSGSIEATNRTSAQIINSQFTQLIEKCKIELLKTEELPIFTTVATSHLIFLQIIEENWKNPKLQIDSATYNSQYKNDIENCRGEYIDYIHKTFELGIQKIDDEMSEKINNAKRNSLIATTSCSDAKENIATLEAALSHQYDEVATLRKLNDSYGAMKAAEKRENIRTYLNEYKQLVVKKHKYIQTTVANGGFCQVAKWGLVEENEKMYYFDRNEQKKIGWAKNGDKWYYLSPRKTDEFEQGQMMTGWLQLGDKWYYL